jgi:hypothetical protein
MIGDGEKCCYNMKNITYEFLIKSLENLETVGPYKDALLMHIEGNKERSYSKIKDTMNYFNK